LGDQSEMKGEIHGTYMEHNTGGGDRLNYRGRGGVDFGRHLTGRMGKGSKPPAEGGRGKERKQKQKDEEGKKKKKNLNRDRSIDRRVGALSLSMPK